MNFISPNTAAQYNIESKIEIQNIQVIQKKLYKVICTVKFTTTVSGQFADVFPDLNSKQTIRFAVEK